MTDEYPHPRITGVTQRDGTVHHIDWDQVATAVVGADPNYRTTNHHNEVRDALIAAHAKLILGDDNYATYQADIDGRVA